ncbi:MAG TPA: ribokinase [Phototrophicaceae bacterium]|nr:ribokinase [Phototrophicaceae bacterium]
MTAKIVVVGSFNADLTSYMERMPRPGETVHGRKFVTGPGGKGSNQAVAAARPGAEVTFIGRIGQDLFGDMALNMWEQEGINTRFVVRDPDRATGVAPIFVDDTGENSIVVVLGANLNIKSADIDAAAAVIAQADVLLIQLEINPDMVAYALKTAKASGIRTILNPAPATQLPAEVITLADFITPNETELEVLSRQTGQSIEAAARSLFTADNQTVVVTLGAKGARYIRSNTSEFVPTYPVKVVDTTGAGDAFNGGLAVALAEGQDLAAAVDFANATAALCVTRLGTAPSMPHRDEVETLLKSR